MAEIANLTDLPGQIMMSAVPQSFQAAIVEKFGEPELLRLGECPTPEIKAHEVLVQVDAAAVTPLDCYLRAGLKVGSYAVSPPYVPGSSLAGRVAAIGADVSRFQPGDRVFGNAKTGSCATLAVCDEHKLHPLIAAIEPEAGAFVSVPYRTAYFALVDLARARGGETVLVHGAGGSVGAAATQVARALGLQVIATCAPGKAEQAREDGAHHVINHRDGNWPELARSAASGKPIAIIIEVAAQANLSLDLDLAAPGGRIVIVGGHGDTRIDPLPVIGKGLSIHGVSLPQIEQRRETEIMASIVAGLENHTLRPRCALTYSLAEVAEAHRAVEAGRGAGGVALTIQS